jgi:anti-sigma B factor antagonist
MEINRSTENGITILELIGNLLGEKDTKLIIEAVENSIENGRVNFIVDLSQLKYINSTGLSVLITMLTKSRNAKGNICIFNVPDQLDKLLGMTQLDKLFPRVANLEEAKKIFQ